MAVIHSSHRNPMLAINRAMFNCHASAGHSTVGVSTVETSSAHDEPRGIMILLNLLQHYHRMRRWSTFARHKMFNQAVGEEFVSLPG